MATKSWLEKAKSIHDLGNDFYVPKSKSAYEWERDVAREDRGLARRREPIPVAEKWLPFFGSRMHDSHVMSVSRKGDDVCVKLDCDSAGIFAVGLADVLPVSNTERQWPVDLLFHQVHYMRAARYTSTAALRFYDTRLLKSDEPQNGPQFLNDSFFDEHERLQWISGIYIREWYKNPNLSSSAFLMIDFERVSVVDRRLKALQEVFGPAVRPLWEDAIAGIDVGDEQYGCWSGPTMESFLMRRMNHHGIKRSDFLV